jgi:hypothetical protein
VPTHREESARRIVISEEFVGDMLPLTQQEMDRQIHLRDGAHIRGGVYGGDIVIEGNVTVEGPVCSRTSIRLAPGDGRIVVNGGLKASHSVVVETSPGPSRVMIRGDVYTKQANLRGTQLLGNLFAAGRVGLENSVVVGFVFTRGDLFASRSSMVSFRARSAALGEGVGLWLPAAFAEEKLELAGPVRCGLLSLNDPCEHGSDTPSVMGLHCPRFQDGTCKGCTTFEADDLHDSRIEAVPLVGDDAPHGYLVLSLVPRIMDLSQLPQAREATLRLLATLKEGLE